MRAWVCHVDGLLAVSAWGCGSEEGASFGQSVQAVPRLIRQIFRTSSPMSRLKSLRALEELDLRCCAIGPAGATAIAEALGGCVCNINVWCVWRKLDYICVHSSCTRVCTHVCARPRGTAAPGLHQQPHAHHPGPFACCCSAITPNCPTAAPPPSLSASTTGGSCAYGSSTSPGEEGGLGLAGRGGLVCVRQCLASPGELLAKKSAVHCLMAQWCVLVCVFLCAAVGSVQSARRLLERPSPHTGTSKPVHVYTER
jgi:hypothetical protein